MRVLQGRRAPRAGWAGRRAPMSSDSAERPVPRTPIRVTGPTLVDGSASAQGNEGPDRLLDGTPHTSARFLPKFSDLARIRTSKIRGKASMTRGCYPIPLAQKWSCEPASPSRSSQDTGSSGVGSRLPRVGAADWTACGTGSHTQTSPCQRRSPIGVYAHGQATIGTQHARHAVLATSREIRTSF